MKYEKLKSSVLLLLGLISMGLQAQTTGTFTDPRDGKVYKTVTIGTQEWMAENLAYKPSSGNYWAYDNDISNVAVYGYLYDWNTAIKACPKGWHIPTNEEWNDIAETLLTWGSVNSNELKEVGTEHWGSSNTEATNETGFTALPGGLRSEEGEFVSIGLGGIWWSATEYNDEEFVDYAWEVDISSYEKPHSDAYVKSLGLSIRCIKDN